MISKTRFNWFYQACCLLFAASIVLYMVLDDCATILQLSTLLWVTVSLAQEVLIVARILTDD